MTELKVLHIIAEMDPKMGGVCEALRILLPGLKKIGVHNEVVSLDSPNSKFIENDPFVIHAIGPAKSPWCYSRTLIPWLSQNINRFDSIILHGLWLFPGFAIEKVINALKKSEAEVTIPSLFIMPHGMLDPYFQKAKGRKLKAFRNWLYWKAIERKVVNKANGLLFTCTAELELARKPFTPYKPKREVVVGLGVAEPPLFQKSMAVAFAYKCPQLQGKPYLLFLSRIHEKKGIDLLVKAYASVIAGGFFEGKETPPKLIIAGPGLDTSYGKHIRTMAESLLPNDIYFPGMLTGDAKWGAFYGCEALVLPSHQENFGIAVVEALACSKPVIVSDQVNIWTEIKSAEAGIITQDTFEMTEKALKVWFRLSLDQKKQMSAKARTAFEEKFSVGPTVFRLKKAIEGT